DDTMENLPVIVAVFCVCREVLYCFRGDILKKFDSYVSVVCMDDRLDFIFLYFIVQLWKCHSNPPKVSNVSILCMILCEFCVACSFYSYLYSTVILFIFNPYTFI